MVTRQNRQTIKTELDLRGYRYEEALNELDQYLDQAVLSNYEQVYIIHGKGTGHFKRCSTTFEKHKSVRQFREVCLVKVDLVSLWQNSSNL